MAVAICSLALASTVFGGGPAAFQDRIAGVDVEGTVIAIRLKSGRALRGIDLKGATLTLTTSAHAAPQKIQIESIKPDPTDPDHELMLYHFLAVDPATHETQELCGPNADGERWGFPVRGQWDEDGRHTSDSGYTLTCSDGAQGKCVRFGYKPWKTLANGTRLAPFHQACIHMITANYCGDRRTTRDGMAIDLFDSAGIQSPDTDAEASGMTFEAAWGPDGALCVAHTRVPENVSLEQLARECPRLVGHLGSSACTEEIARHLAVPALMYNRSR